MNHYDALIRDYLYEHRTVSFEKVGSLTIERQPSPDQPQTLLPGTVNFIFNKRAVTTPELADFIAAKTGKNRVLITSDLESYVETMRQFMNIGNPYEIEGVGILKLGQSGEYGFSPFDYSHRKDESRSGKRHREKSDSPLMAKRNSNKNVLILFALIIVLGVLGVVGWGTYKLLIENKSDNASISADTVQTTVPVTTLPDTTNTTVDSINKPDTTVALTTTDSVEYKFIHETTTSAARAYERMRSLKEWGHPSMVDSAKRDSVTVYTLYFKYKLSNADTASMRDSIFKLLNRKIMIRPVM